MCACVRVCVCVCVNECACECVFVCVRVFFFSLSFFFFSFFFLSLFSLFLFAGCVGRTRVCVCSNDSNFINDKTQIISGVSIITPHIAYARTNKSKSCESRWNFYLTGAYAPHVYVRAWTLCCFHSLISTQTFGGR